MAKKRRKISARRAVRKIARRARSFVTNPAPRRRRRSYRKNPSFLGNAGEVVKMGAGALGGALLIPRACQFVPVGSTVLKNAAGLAVSGALAYFGRKNPIALGAGLGGAAVCARNLITNAVPMLAGDDLTQDEAAALAYEMSGAEEYEMSAPLMGAPTMGAPLMGDLNTPAL